MKKILFGLILISLAFLASCGGPKQPVDIINPDAEYRYFFGATCPHCQELNRIANENDLYSRISIEKREVYSNTENRDMFLALAEEIGAEGSGVPFVYDTVTGEYAVGVKPALELMTSRLGNKASSQTENTQSTQEIAEDNVQEETATGEIIQETEAQTESTTLSGSLTE